MVVTYQGLIAAEIDFKEEKNKNYILNHETGNTDEHIHNLNSLGKVGHFCFVF